MNYPAILTLVALLAAFFPLRSAAQAPESVMVVEAHSGKILFASNAGVKRPVASLTKIATAAVAIDWATATNTDLGRLNVTVPQVASLLGGPNPMSLRPGDRLTMRDALYSALLGSDNFAALTIADHVGREILSRRGAQGDPVREFVAEMNKLARVLGMLDTRFTNPHGLDTGKGAGVSTAVDMARLSVDAMRRPALNFIVRQEARQVTVFGVDGKRGFRVPNSNKLVGEPGIMGIKTGTTSAAGPCLATCMDREPLVRMRPDGTRAVTPRRLIVVVLNNPDRFNRTRALIRQGWASYDAWISAGGPVGDPKREILVVPQPR
jgi:serine-type D-Ala-D-Ala carboxypeptidase (penicillin-binding protein 5/6)